MAHQISVPSSATSGTETASGATEVTTGVAYQKLGIVNVVYLGLPQAGDRGWVLVDAGVPGVGAVDRIAETAAERFGSDARPAAIVLTHGHVDHVGALEELAERWDAPVYAHPLEHPYLDGSAAYPPPDPTASKGLMAKIAPLFPRDPVDVSNRLIALPMDGRVPGVRGWQWLHTPGHTPGHVSLWRVDDRILVAGDAVITTNQESAYAVALQKPEVHGPPMYFTPDWPAARASARKLADLNPDRLVTGHGPALGGIEMRDALRELARRFDDVAVPAEGTYVGNPAIPGDGAYRPPSGT